MHIKEVNHCVGVLKMNQQDRYSINTTVKFEGLELIDIPKLIRDCNKEWQNFSLCEVNDCVVRLGVIHGEFHWHRHDREDEFFYVINSLLYIDLENKTVKLKPGQGFLVPRGVAHRTRAPRRTAILMVEGKNVRPIGD
jgi:mannose-6-phosphate isomerase-like protein (cupin superfamily)